MADVCRRWEPVIQTRQTQCSTRRRRLLGEGTENQATIVASTSLRLFNLQKNFDHIIGGPKSGRPGIDLTKLLQVPAVLKTGMIGDSQALSLVMAFLVVSLVGCIENRNRNIRPSSHARY